MTINVEGKEKKENQNWKVIHEDGILFIQKTYKKLLKSESYI